MFAPIITLMDCVSVSKPAFTKLTTMTSPAMKADKGGKPDATQSTQKMMLYFMPFFMAYISWTVPAGLALYFLTMNIVSILQQLYINRRLDKEKLDAAVNSLKNIGLKDDYIIDMVKNILNPSSDKGGRNVKG